MNEKQDRLRILADMLKPDRQAVIVDVGASPINPAPYDDLIECGLAKVIGFEPQEAEFEKLKEAGGKGRTFLPYAIGDGSDGTLNVCRHSGFSSLLKPNPALIKYLGRWKRNTEVVSEVAIQTRRLDDIKELGDIDFLKIDIQGGELAVFKNAKKTLKTAIAVMSEVAAVPLYEGQPLLHQQMAELHSQGFSLHKFDFFKGIHLETGYSQHLRKRRHTNQLVDGDAIFLRGLMDLDALDAEKLKQMALIGDAVFGSFDLVLKIVEVLARRQDIDGVADAYLDVVPFNRR